ncbi:MAG: hypothetical protein ACRCZI_07945, partial [Cetobacterium sp.]
HVQGQNIARPEGNKRAEKAKYGEDFSNRAIRESVSVQKEHVAAIRDLNKATYALSDTIRQKSYQESDMNLAMMNYKMGKREESEYHMTRAGERSERWREEEAKAVAEAAAKDVVVVDEEEVEEKEDEEEVGDSAAL